MSAKKTNIGLSQYSLIGDLAANLRQLLVRVLPWLAGILLFETARLYSDGNAGATAFALISLGCWIAFKVWSEAGQGLPLMPTLVLQTLIAFGLPIVVNNKAVMTYPEGDLTAAGLEVVIMSCSLAAFWRAGMSMFSNSSPLCYALRGFDEERTPRLERLGFGLVIASTLFQVLRSLQLLDVVLNMLPAGTSSIITTVLAGTCSCGFFLVAMIFGRGGMGMFKQTLFWGSLAVNCFIMASNFLLSSTATIIFSVLIGLFWSNGRVPWRFLLVVITSLCFLNLGKTTMRERYWRLNSEDSTIPDFTLQEMPAHYQEWIEASYDEVTMDDTAGQPGESDFFSGNNSKGNKQSILDRINNLQNILFVVDAVQHQHIEPLDGATYTLIPALLIPRVFWPDKPRTHEGQVLLDVHFGRQAFESSFQTYIAWGLLAEAYGNFGPYLGALLLGLFLGLICAWVEKYVARKLLLSMEGFLSFALLLGLANSFEMVASVLVTSVFQSFFPVIIASAPYVQRILPVQPGRGKE